VQRYLLLVLIETPRLLLRPLERGDLDDFVALHADAQVTEFIRPLDRRESEERLDRDAGEWQERGHGLLGIFDRRAGAFLGRCGVKYWPQFDETEVGWILKTGAWGQGYATEAGQACIEWAFSNFEISYVTAMISPSNLRSIRVAERLKLVPLRKDMLLGDPVVVYKLDQAGRRQPVDGDAGPDRSPRL
jgi:RimJ/RimL family protein N-acetyltransferase